MVNGAGAAAGSRAGGGGRGISKPRMQRGFRDATGQLIVDTRDDGMDNLSDKEISLEDCLENCKIFGLTGCGLDNSVDGKELTRICLVS